MKITKKPLISVLIPVYIAEKYLEISLKSLFNQSFQDFEIVAVDDGSTDRSWSILKKLAKKNSSLRVYKNPTNRNIAYTLNRAVRLARGQYLARMDADDIALKNRFQKQIKYLRNHPDTVVLGTNCYTIDENNQPLSQKKFPLLDRDIRSLWFLLNPMQHPTMLINRTLLPKNFHWYNEALPPAEDLDLLFRLAKYGKLRNLHQKLLYYRLYPQSETFKHPLRTYLATKKVRDLAISCYGYTKPSFIKFLNLIQEILIRVLPAHAIYFIYNNLRSAASLISEKQIKHIPQHPELKEYRSQVAFNR